MRSHRRSRPEPQVATVVRRKLEEAGYTSLGEFMCPQGGESHSTFDIMRWQIWGNASDGRRVLIGSWDKLGSCAKRGFTLAPGSEAGDYVDVDAMANPKRKR